MSKPAKTTEIRKLREMAEAGFSRVEASKELGRSTKFVYNWAAKEKIEWRPRKSGPARKL